MSNMMKDYAYCHNKGSCIHRRGCKRWIGNYTDKEVHKLYSENKFVSEIDESLCIPDYTDKDCTNSYGFLDRFRLSTGESFE